MSVNRNSHRMPLVASLCAILTLTLLAGCKPTYRGTVSGRIVDESGAPVEGAEVVVRDLSADDERNDTRSYSGRNGSFAVPVRCEHGGLSVYAKGYASLQCTRKIAGGANPDWTIRLTKLVSVSGRVLDTQGNPVPDRILNFAPLRTPAGDGSEIAYDMECAGKEECTDAEGRFNLSGIAPLKCRITVGHVRDHLRQQPVNGEVFDLTAAGNRTNLEIRIHPPQDYAISGHICDGKGDPVRGVFVDTYTIPHGLHWYTFSDDKGAFCLEGLDGMGQDAVDIHFRAPSGVTATRTGVPLHTKDLEITVP